MAERYPSLEPHASGRLEVAQGHTLYWEEVGTPDGLPAVYLHSGPRSGSHPHARRYFDPTGYRVGLFDQRGCVRNRPLAYHLGAIRHLINATGTGREAC